MNRHTKDENGPGSQDHPAHDMEWEDNGNIGLQVGQSFRQTLGLDAVHGCSHFFMEGGDSLLAIQLLVALNRTWPDMVPSLNFTDLMENPTAGQLSRQIAMRLPAIQRDVA